MFDVVGVVEGGRKLVGWDARAGSDDELTAAAVALARLGSLVEVAVAHVAAELDARGVCDREFGLSTPVWLAREAGVPVASGRRWVRTGRVLRAWLAGVDDAVVDGQVSFAHAAVLADVCNPRVASRVGEVQGELVAAAGLATFERWRAEVRGLVDQLDQDGGSDPARDVARNQVSVTDSFDGATRLRGELVGDVALGVKDAIDAKADELFHRYRRDQETVPDTVIPSRATLRALALAELCRGGAATDLRESRPPRPEITLVASVLRCDADLQAVIIDSLGVPLAMGRKVRLATSAQRKALAVRDGGCVFPGCPLPAHWTDAHHLDPYHLGGRTDVDRLISLCRRHHGIAHRKGWKLRTTADGWTRWQTPTGRTFSGQRHHRRRPDPPPDATP